MHRYKEHFLDSNVVLNFLLFWNDSTDCYNYFQRSFNKNISEKVFRECETVISRLKRIQINFLKNFNLYMSSRDIFYFDTNIISFSRIFIKKNHHDYDLSEKKFKKIIMDFIEDLHEDIYKAVSNGLDYKNFLKIINETFFTIGEYLEDLCTGDDSQLILHRKFPNSYAFKYPDVFDDLEKLPIHYSDRQILLDCHHFKETILKEDLAFLTSDKDVLDNEENIFRIINIHTFQPT
jgi:hypothetical protein